MRLTDKNGIMVGVNKMFCRLVGKTEEELVGQPFATIYGEDELAQDFARPGIPEFPWEKFSTRTVTLYSGRTISLDVQVSPVESKGRKFLLSVFRDMDELQESKEALHAAEKQLETIHQQEVVFVITREGSISSVSPGFERATGWKRQEWVGKEFHPILHPDDVKTAWRSFRKTLRGEKSEAVELRVRDRDGRYLTGEFSWSPRFREGRVVSLTGTARDITGRKRTEELVQVERNHLRTLIDNLPDLIYFKDAEGRYLLNNRAHLHSIGVERQEEVLGKTTFDFNPIELAAKYHRDELRIVATGEPILLEEEVAVHRDTGAQRWHLTSKIPLVGTQGAVEGIIGISRDITESKRTEDALRGSEEKYRSLFENSVQPMFQSSPGGELLNANKALLTLLGYGSLEELSAINAVDLYANPEARGELRQALETKGYLSNIELQLKRRNGQVITVLEHSRVLKDENGTVTAYEGILEDITARKALEQKLSQYLGALENSQKVLADLNSEKDKLLSVLSHDLRSPFSSILGFCEILMKEDESLTKEERMQFLSYVKEAAKDQLSLVNRLLDWSKLESGRVRMEIKDLDLSVLATRCVHALLGLAKQKKVELVSRLPEGLVIRGDEEQARQVLENLIGNALKFTPEQGSITIELAAAQAEGMIGISIRDTGIGIPEADLPRMFRVEEKYTRKGLAGEKGTGLGLPVCAEIMQKHSGTITVESAVGAGTTFTLTFPTNISKKEGMNILIVDDEEGVRVLHTRYVKRFLPQANILYATNGQEAIDAAQKHHPQAIVADYSMPVLNGFDMLVQLKKDAATKNVPVFIVTGEESKACVESMKLTGAAGIFSKPVLPEQLGSALKSVVQEFPTP